VGVVGRRGRRRGISLGRAVGVIDTQVVFFSVVRFLRGKSGRREFLVVIDN
jgi:hypothetical protein